MAKASQQLQIDENDGYCETCNKHENSRGHRKCDIRNKGGKTPSSSYQDDIRQKKLEVQLISRSRNTNLGASSIIYLRFSFTA